MSKSKNKNLGSSKSNSDDEIDPELREIMQEARANGWGQSQQATTSRIKNKTNPMLRQTSISELPYDEWAESEVLQATMGSDEDIVPSYSPEIAEMMMIEDPEMRKNNLSKRDLWSNAAHVARARRYKEEGKDVRDEDKKRLRKLGKKGGKPESKANKNFRVLKDGINKNRRHIGALNRVFNERLQQQQQDINNLKNAIGDNRQRDQNISEISHNLALLKSFVTEKLSNHPKDYEDFVNHLSNQSINDSIVPIQGGRRKTRKHKNKKKHTRKVKRKRKTRRKKAGTRPDRRSNRVYPQPTEIENINYIEPNRRGRETLWREYNVNIRDLPRARYVRTRELPLAQEVVVGKVHETPRQHMINLAKKCKNKFDSACRTVKRMARRELSGSGRRKRKTRRRKK